MDWTQIIVEIFSSGTVLGLFVLFKSKKEKAQKETSNTNSELLTTTITQMNVDLTEIITIMRTNEMKIEQNQSKLEEHSADFKGYKRNFYDRDNKRTNAEVLHYDHQNEVKKASEATAINTAGILSALNTLNTNIMSLKRN